MCYSMGTLPGVWTREEKRLKPPKPRTSDDIDREFRAQLKGAVRKLERAVDDLLKHFWEEPLRRHADETASALLAACKASGYLELVGIVRAIVSLVQLPLSEVIALEDALRAKLMELLVLLKEMADAIAA